MKIDQNKIKKEAKKIMDEFIQELDKIKLSDDFGKERTHQTRTDFKNESVETSDNFDNTFREIMFKNAPLKRNGFIVAEKKSW